MNRRSAIAVLGVGAMASRTARAAGLPAGWARFKARFVSADGRVVDTGNGGISHSEGQGYGMLLAAACDDAPTFDRLWTWTRRTLGLRRDGLLAWKAVPEGRAVAVPDRNNASDGDLLVAWALARASARWSLPGRAGEARALARALRLHATRPDPRGLLLLPGVEGFVHDGVPTVNLSYWVFPAFRALARLDPDPAWGAIEACGLRLVREARFGPRGLPPDWLALGTPPAPAASFPPVFGYNAIRIPLHLAWAGLGGAEALAPFVDLWGGTGPLPAVVDLETGRPGPDPASPGVRAIAAVARWRPGDPLPPLPDVDEAADYYGAALVLLSHLALIDRGAA